MKRQPELISRVPPHADMINNAMYNLGQPSTCSATENLETELKLKALEDADAQSDTSSLLSAPDMEKKDDKVRINEERSDK